MYHKNNNWKERYIDEARKTITDLYESWYLSAVNELVENDSPEDDLFHHIYKKRRLSNKNELELYFGIPIILGEVNLLEW